MAYDDLRGFLKALDKDGDLKRIRAEVDPYLEITEIVTRVVKEGGPALLFENVRGSAMPLAINIFGTERRMARALGVKSMDEIGHRIGELLKPELPHGFSGFREALGKVAQLRAVPPKKVKDAPCQQVVHTGDAIDLTALPGLHTWPDDGGVFLNYGLTHTKHPETGARNVGLYRLQVHGARSLGLHWQIHKDSRQHYAVAERDMAAENGVVGEDHIVADVAVVPDMRPDHEEAAVPNPGGAAAVFGA